MFARALRLSRGLAGAAAGAAALRFASCDAAKDEGEQARRRKPPITAASVTKRGDGGILPEYKSVPRGVRCVEPPAEGFFGKEVLVLGVPVRAHETVSDAALVVAADRLSRMLRNLPEAVRERLARRGASFHVIGVGQGTSDLPEHRHMKGVDGGYTGEVGVSLDQRTRGMGGVLSSCGEENLLDLDSDPRYAGRDILTHEFAHCVMDVGLPPSLVAEIRQTWEKSVNRHGRWKRSDGV